MRVIGELSYPPKQLTDSSNSVAFERWAGYAGRPRDWLHHRALTRKRLAAIDRLFRPEWRGHMPTAPRASISDWLEALVEGQEDGTAVRASMAAVQTAAAIPAEIRANQGLGDIVLMASGGWQSPDPERLFLPDESSSGSVDPASCVHPKLIADRETLSALKKLGLKPPSSMSVFRSIAKRVLGSDSHQEMSDDIHREFWVTSRKVSVETATAVIREHSRWPGNFRVWPKNLRIRTCADTWQPPYAVLLPGDIVAGEGSQDDDATVDMDFHQSDEKLLRVLGVVGAPSGGTICHRKRLTGHSALLVEAVTRDGTIYRTIHIGVICTSRPLMVWVRWKCSRSSLKKASRAIPMPCCWTMPRSSAGLCGTRVQTNRPIRRCRASRSQFMCFENTAASERRPESCR